MADITSTITRYSGFLIPGPYWDPANLWAAQSTYTEQSPRAPIPELITDSDLALTGSGTIWDAEDIDLKGFRSGFPVPEGGAFIWKPQSDGATLWRGWDAPNVLSGWEEVRWTDGSVLSEALYHPHVVALPNGKIVCVAEQYTSTAGGTYKVTAFIRTPATGAWSSPTTVYSTTDALTQRLYPCLVLLPSGRLLCFFWREDVTRVVAQMSCYFSDDDGATWAAWQDFCLIDEIDLSGTVSLRRIRAIYHEAQIALVYQEHDTANLGLEDEFVQLASSDLGASFAVIVDSPGTEIQACPDWAIVDGRLVLAFFNDTDSTAIEVLDHAWRSHLTVTRTAVSWAGGAVTWDTGNFLGDLALVCDEDQTLYLLVRDTTNMWALMKASTDYGATWAYMSNSPRGAGIGVWSDLGDAGSYVARFAACSQGGRLVVLHQWTADPGNEDNSIGALYLGGYSTVTLPGLQAFQRIDERTGWTRTWIAIERPGDLTPWTAAGAAADTLTDGWLVIPAVANNRTFTVNPTGTIAEGIIACFRVDQTSGGSLAASDIAARFRIADGANDYEVTLRFAATGFRAYDAHAGAAVGTDATVAVSSGVDVLVAIASGQLVTWYRAATCGEDREWTPGPAGALLTDAVTPNANHEIVWGAITAAGTSTAAWQFFHYADDEYTGLQLTGFVNPTNLLPRCFSAYALEVYGGAKVRAVDGPVGSADEWDLDARAQYPVENIFPSEQPSPRAGWRSIGDATECTIAVLVDPALTAAAQEEIDIVGLWVAACNWRAGKFQGRTGGGVWQDLASIDLATGQASLEYVTRGNRVAPNAVAAAGPLYAMDECTGWTADLGGGKLRRVTCNGPGKWTNTAAQPAVLVLDGCDGTEAASGTLSLWASDAVIVVHLSGARFAAYRILVDDQNTVDDDLRIGTAIIGPVVPLPERYSWGRIIETEANVTVTSAIDGSTRSRRNGPPARVVQAAWTDGLDQTTASGGTAAPDYWAATTTAGAVPVASRRTTATLLEGMLRRLDGPHRIAVYLPSLTKATAAAGNVQHLLRRDQFIPVRLESPVRVETVLGEERISEVVRIATIVGREVT